MILQVHSDASYLSETKSRSRAGGFHFLGAYDPTSGVPPNGFIDMMHGTWVATHPEARNTHSAFSTLDWGHCWTDKAAGGQLTDTPGSLPHTPDWTHVALTLHDLIVAPSFRGTSWTAFKGDESVIGNAMHDTTKLISTSNRTSHTDSTPKTRALDHGCLTI